MISTIAIGTYLGRYLRMYNVQYVPHFFVGAVPPASLDALEKIMMKSTHDT